MKRVIEAPLPVARKKHATNGKSNGVVVTSVAPPPTRSFGRRPGHKTIVPEATATKPTTTPAPKIDAIGHGVITVTPEMAERFLEGKLPNRNLKDRDIERYIRDIQNGAWHLNGETMVFAGNERAVRSGLPEAGLLDGQQRCWAISLAGVAVQVLAAWDVPIVSMESMDSGVRRSFSDVLAINGRKYTSAVAGAARLIIWHEEARGVGTTHNSLRPTNHELMRVVDEHPALDEAAALAGSSKLGRFLSPVISTFVICMAIELGLRAEAEEFMSILSKGTDLTRQWGPTHPVYHLYQRLQQFRAEKSYRPQLEVAAYVIKAFNAFAAGRQMRVLRYAFKGDRPEPFPVLESHTGHKAVQGS